MELKQLSTKELQNTNGGIKKSTASSLQCAWANMSLAAGNYKPGAYSWGCGGGGYTAAKILCEK